MRAAAFAFCPQKTTETTPFRVFEQRRRHHQQRIGRHFITEFYRRKRRPSSSFSALSSSSEMPKTTPESLKRLQNGSDVRGVALAGVENEPITITPESVFCLGCAFVDWLREKEKCTNNPACTVGIGRDPRVSGPSLKDAFARGVQFKGGVAIDCELSTTPACFFATVANRELGPAYEGCAMLTASHLPFNRNGIKFFYQRWRAG